MPKKTWAEQWGEKEIDWTMKETEMRKLAKKVQNLTERRIKSIERQGYYSYAGDKLREQWAESTKPISRMNRWELSSRLAELHHFWESKTSTLKGAKEEIERQSARIFGTNQKGRAVRRLTREEASAYWAAYDEFYNQYKGATARYDSFRLQRVLGSAFSMNADGANLDLMGLLEDVRRQMDAELDLGLQFDPVTGLAINAEEVFRGGNGFNF